MGTTSTHLRLVRWAGLALSLGLVTGACGSSDNDPRAYARREVDIGGTVLASLTRAESCTDATDLLKGAAAASVESGMGFGGIAAGGVTLQAVAERSASDGATTSAGAPGDGSVAAPESPATGGGEVGGAVPFSTTNIQEAGVDEPDLVKTDGSTIYVLRDNKVRILDAVTLDERATIATAATDQASWFSSLLLDGDVLLVMGQTGGYAQPVSGIGVASGFTEDLAMDPQNYRPRTEMARYDVSNPAGPALIDRTVVDGHFVNARLSGGVARVVTADSGAGGVPLPEPLVDGDPLVMKRQLLDAIDDAPVDAFLPSFEVIDESGTVRQQGMAVACDQVYAPTYETGPSTLTVHTVDLDGGYSPAGAVSILAGGEIVYASADTLYVATSRYRGGVIGGIAVMPEPGGVVTNEPTADPTPPSVTTEVHAFDIGGSDAARYEGSGQVTGTVLNQYSMSEHDSVLRIATTNEGWGGPESESFVTTLRAEGDELVQVGQVGGLGKGERIYAVRFIGATGYVVTFRQVDPLYVVDLSDPVSPTVVGELKIEGYSAYLHPTSAGRLLGLGQDATLEGQRLGTQMSLFDVSNPARPTRISQVGFGQGSDSSAEYDPHAFLWWAPKGLVVVPLTRYSYDERSGTESFEASAVLVRLENDQLTEVGRIRHVPKGAASGSPSAVEFGYMVGIERSLVVGNRLITISNVQIAANDLDSLAEVAVHRFQ